MAGVSINKNGAKWKTLCGKIGSQVYNFQILGRLPWWWLPGTRARVGRRDKDHKDRGGRSGMRGTICALAFQPTNVRQVH
jgi:hypothetical protein